MRRSIMNVEQQKRTTAVIDVTEQPRADFMTVAKPVGTFAGEGDFILRIHDGNVITANTGEQGGGQN
ncbi:MAG: hypothetical protein JO170_31035 [Verrucomicrobia bacterium]|nr:hypothetical protein [Verrucomicrobiota bacterium]